MQNGVFDLYSLIRFLRIRPYNESTQFEAAFGVLKRGTGREITLNRAMKRLQALLRSILLRRTKKSTIDGKPIIDLPPKTEEVSSGRMHSSIRLYRLKANYQRSCMPFSTKINRPIIPLSRASQKLPSTNSLRQAP